MSQTQDPGDQQDSTKGGSTPGESLGELRRGGDKVGASEDELAAQQASVEAAKQEAERLRNEPGHHGRDHL